MLYPKQVWLQTPVTYQETVSMRHTWGMPQSMRDSLLVLYFFYWLTGDVYFPDC